MRTSTRKRFFGGVAATTVAAVLGALVTVSPASASGLMPNAVDDSYTTLPHTVLVVDAPGVLANDSDPEGDPLTASLDGTWESLGSVLLDADGGFEYTPPAGEWDEDSFFYWVSDGTSENLAMVTIVANNPPVARNDRYSTRMGRTLYVDAPGVLDNDTDPQWWDTLTAKLSNGPSRGTLTLRSTGRVVYVPQPEWSGVVTFTYRAFDGQAYSNTATVTITVKQPTAITATVSRGTLTYGQGVTLRARVTKGTVPVRYQPVTLQRCRWWRDAGFCDSWRTIANRQTNRYGRASYVDHPPWNAHYRWVFDGTSVLMRSRSRVVQTLVRTSTYAHTADTSMSHNTWFTLYVTVRPNHAGNYATLQFDQPGRGWTFVDTVYLSKISSTRSRGSIRLVLYQRMDYRFRVVMPSDGDHLRTVSATLVIHST